MTYVNLAPSSTVVNSGALTGGASAHAVLADASDSTYVVYENGEASILGITDLSLPAGAVVVLAQVWARCRQDGLWSSSVLRTNLSAGTGSAEISQVITWVTPTNVAGCSLFGGLSDADVDGATMAVSNTSSFGLTRVTQLYLRVLYLLKPTVTVDAPTGTVTQNRLKVEWTPTFDPDAQGSPSFYEVAVFTAAQYGIGGFNPATSPATLRVGQSTAGPDCSHEFSDAVLDGTYRAYVRVAAGNSPDHKSDWTYGAFVVDAPNPGVPSMVLTAVPVSGAVSIALDDSSGDVVTNLFELERSDDGGVTWNDVRTRDGDGMVTPSGGLATVMDYEAKNGVEATYRVRAFNAATPSYSVWVEGTVTWSSDDWWLKHSSRPSLNRRLRMRSYPGSSTEANQGVFRPLGSSVPVVVSDVRGPTTGEIVVWTESLAEREALELALSAQAPMLLQGPVSNEQPERWVVIGSTSSDRIFDVAWAPYHDETLPWTQVVRPDGPIEE